MWRRIWAWITEHERLVSALAMIAGFIIDNIFFGQIDLLRTQLVFIAYIVLCVFSIGLLHWYESRSRRPRWRAVLPITTQFALGGFWSGFLIFYSRSAVLSTSWPFLLLLFAIFIGNEIFKKYHDRLVFTCILFFFALYAYAIFAVPLLTHTIGTRTFLESGAVAIVAFVAFLAFLRWVGRERYLAEAWPIRAGALGVLLVINFFYFTNILPPLPLALAAGGIYHEVDKTATGYEALAEVAPSDFFDFEPTLHVAPGDSLSAYSAVFAPIALSTTITHQWQWYDPASKKWVDKLTFSFPIEGGRDGGYRGYSTEENPTAGQWRVEVETSGGLVVGILRFEVVDVATPPPEVTKVLE